MSSTVGASERSQYTVSAASRLSARSSHGTKNVAARYGMVVVASRAGGRRRAALPSAPALVVAQRAARERGGRRGSVR